MVSRYIHLNPAKVGSVKRKPPPEQLDILWGYHWSSLPGLVALKKLWDFVEYGVVLEDFGGDTRQGRARYKKQVSADLADKLPVRKNIVAQSVLGGEDFVEEIKATYLEADSSREQPALAKVRKYFAKDKILDVLCRITGKSQKQLLFKTGTERQMTMDFLYRLAGMTNLAIGHLMKVDYSTVSQGRKRFRGKLRKDKSLQTMSNKIENELSKIKI